MNQLQLLVGTTKSQKNNWNSRSSSLRYQPIYQMCNFHYDFEDILNSFKNMNINFSQIDRIIYILLYNYIKNLKLIKTTIFMFCNLTTRLFVPVIVRNCLLLCYLPVNCLSKLPRTPCLCKFVTVILK